MSLKRIASLMAAALAVALSAPALAGGITTRQMATSSSAPAAVPGTGAAGTSDAVARADHSHACTAASAGAAGCLQPADYQSFSGKVASVTGTAPIVSSGGATPAISCTAASASTGGCVSASDWARFDMQSASRFGRKFFRTVYRNGTATSPASIESSQTLYSITTPVFEAIDGTRGGSRYSVQAADAEGGNYIDSMARWIQRPTLSVPVRTYEASDLDVVVWLAVTPDRLAIVNGDMDPVLGASASTVSFVAVTYDARQSANWMCCAANGTAAYCLDTQVAVNPNSVYNVTVDYREGSSLVCTINGTSAAVTSSLPATADVAVGVLTMFRSLAYDVDKKHFNIGAHLVETY